MSNENFIENNIFCSFYGFFTLFHCFNDNFFTVFLTKYYIMGEVRLKGIRNMQPFTERVVEIIKNIPDGKVMTYGQIAREAGSPRAARQVVRALHSMSRKHRLPWHRVVNAKGQIALQDDESYHEQLFSLESEGIEIGLNGTIDLEKYQYHP
jgi:methylated-DNA-protein-cysteine methyltransferase related protein